VTSREAPRDLDLSLAVLTIPKPTKPIYSSASRFGVVRCPGSKCRTGFVRETWRNAPGRAGGWPCAQARLLLERLIRSEVGVPEASIDSEADQDERARDLCGRLDRITELIDRRVLDWCAAGRCTSFVRNHRDPTKPWLAAFARQSKPGVLTTCLRRSTRSTASPCLSYTLWRGTDFPGSRN